MLLTAKQMSQPDDDPYLFLNSNGQRFKKPGAFSQWMSRTFLKICKKPLTAGMLRKAFVTKITADAQLPRTKEVRRKKWYTSPFFGFLTSISLC